MLILPPFQGEGHGAQLLEAVHRFYCGLPKVQDITGKNFFFFFFNPLKSQNAHFVSSFIQFDLKHFNQVPSLKRVWMCVDSWRPVWELREAEGLCAVQAVSELAGLRRRQAAPRLLWWHGQRGSRQAESQQGAASCWLFYDINFKALQIRLTKLLFLTVETRQTRVWNPAHASDGHERWGSSKRVSLGGEEEAFWTVQGELLTSSELHRYVKRVQKTQKDVWVDEGLIYSGTCLMWWLEWALVSSV